MEEGKNTIFNEIKELEEKKENLNKTVNEINAFSSKLKDKLNEEDINIENKMYQLHIEKDKLKNDKDIQLLTQENQKLEQFLQLLSKKYELEAKYIEDYCEHKSKIEKIGEKYSHINIKSILPLNELFNQEINGEKKVAIKKTESIITPPPPPIQQTEPIAKRRNTIATVINNPEIENNTNDIRQTGSLQDQLKHAFDTKYKALRPGTPT